MRLYMAAARRPPRSDPQNNHDFLPNAMPRSALSAALFERQTRHRRGSVWRSVFAELAQAIAAAAFTRRWRIDHHALAGKMIGERIAFEARARKSAYNCRPGDGSLGRKLVFGGVGFQLFERQRQLVDHPRRAPCPR